MKMKLTAAMVAFALVAASGAFAAEETWKGKISDSNCGAKHMTAEHGKKMSDAECTKTCVKNGAQYVFVHEGRVYKISNQDFADLAAHAGHTVELTGELTDETIKVSKVEMPAKKKAAKATGKKTG